MKTYETNTYTPAPVKPSAWWWLFTLLIAGAMCLLVWVGARTVWQIRTLQYELTATELQIPFGPTVVRISRSEITGVTVLTPTGGLRRNGTGLPNLQAGHWTFRETGRIRMYSTTTRPLTVLETAGTKFGISPADREGFLKALESGGTGVFAPVAAPTGFGGYLVFLLMLGTPFLVVALLVYLGRVGRSIRYVLDPEALQIHCGFSHIRVPYSRMSDARVDSPAGTPWKTWGAWMPGLYWGGFAWSGTGPRLRMYATAAQPIVLVFTDRHTFGINPADPTAFIADLRRRLTGIVRK